MKLTLKDGTVEHIINMVRSSAKPECLIFWRPDKSAEYILPDNIISIELIDHDYE